jgi:hypothetical protein
LISLLGHHSLLHYRTSPLEEEDNNSSDLTSSHYTGADHASAYEAAFFYSSGNDYTKYLQMLVQNRLGILTDNNDVMNDIGMVPDDHLATGQVKQKEPHQRRHRILDIGCVISLSHDFLLVIVLNASANIVKILAKACA